MLSVYKKIVLGGMVASFLSGTVFSQSLLLQECQDFTVQTLNAMRLDSIPYDQFTELGSHNAFTNIEDGWKTKEQGGSGQQSLGFDAQFDYGVRAFFIDLHWCENSTGNIYLAMAHEPEQSPNNKNYTNSNNYKYLEPCIYSPIQRNRKGDIPPFEDFLIKLKKWFDKDSSAVITLHLESYTGTDGHRVISDLLKKVGLDRFVYAKAASSSWPTFGEMRSTGKRLVIFSDNKNDGFFHTDHYRETEYNLGSHPNCEMRSDNRNTNKTSTLLTMNHFHSTSHDTSTCSFDKINNPQAVLKRADECYKQQGIYPTVFVCDHVSQGDRGGCREAVMLLNDYRAHGNTCVTSLISNLSNTTNATTPSTNPTSSWNIGSGAVSLLSNVGEFIWPASINGFVSDYKIATGAFVLPLGACILDIPHKYRHITCSLMAVDVAGHFVRPVWNGIKSMGELTWSYGKTPLLWLGEQANHYGKEVMSVGSSVGYIWSTVKVFKKGHGVAGTKHVVASTVLSIFGTALAVNAFILPVLPPLAVSIVSGALVLPFCWVLYKFPTWLPGHHP